MKPEKELGDFLIQNKLTIATAESCTGGLLSSKLTDVPGSSAYTKLNFVTYANEAKHEILGVSWDILNTYGAVSEECAQAMAEGLQKVTNCDIALCTTGIAGPDGGTKEKPVGLVYIGLNYKGITTVKEIKLPSSYTRTQMKEEFANHALKFAISNICNERLADI